MFNISCTDNPSVAMSNILVYDTEPNPAYQGLSSHSGRATVQKPAGGVNYYEDINDQNITMTEI